ncbi:Fic family protein [Pseudanabaena sp. CCNP1317]|uniref:Fic family protein n=1 Tax=Pseudanabaena sp. CCNP1317 TaxID=3110253 RepID=UPI002B1E9154|nr:Fic family protein [Pseudanabaena sp. CCNP1317]MEA5486632.1 Fic family protein [Pseudanabaena sp. CCNP1317]
MDDLDLDIAGGGEGRVERRGHPRAGALSPLTTGGYRTFEPVGLPPVGLDLGRLEPALSAANLAVGRLDGLSRFVPSVDLFVAMFIRKEAVLSSRIEGTQATLDDVLRFEAGALVRADDLSRDDEALLADVGEVFSYIRAMRECLRRVRSGERVSMGMITDAHATLMGAGGGVGSGCVRETQNWISAQGGSPSRSGVGDAIFVPPSPETLGAHLDDLFQFIRVDSTGTGGLPTLVRAGVAHAQFETIHPFLDGNGRLGRLLVTLMLVREGALREPLLYLSAFLTAHKPDYYAKLTAIRERGDWEGWLAFFLRGVREVATDACAAAEKIPSLLDEHRALVERELPGKPTAARFVDALARSPVVTVKKIAEVMDVTIPTANTLASDFERIGLLEEVTGRQRDRVFRYARYLSVLGE